LDLPLSINQKILDVTGTRELPVKLRTFYTSSKGVFSYIEKKNVTVHSKNYLTWNNTAYIGSFITPQEETVSSFVRKSVSMYKQKMLPGFNKKLQEALAASREPGKHQEEKPEEKKPEKPVQAEKKPAAVEPAAKAASPEKPRIDVTKSLKAAELYTKKEDFEKAIEVLREVLDLDAENIIVQQRLREVYDLQEKKIKKAASKTAPASERKIEAEKITTEDILDVMKEAVEDDKVEEEEKKPEPKKEPPAAEKPETAAPAAQQKKEEKPAAQAAAGKEKEIEKILKGLGDVEGVVGSFFLQRDGKIVASVLPASINASDIGKHIATIVDRTEQSVKSMDQGKLNQVVISAESGQLLFTEVGNGVLFMIGNEGINVGKMRLILKDVIDRIKKVL
ncbi:MAG TPA: roadblock/LC7 domain-containing protein, partial [Candidatus Goldiibacteriota bacterium]|nr:roadblock/LC7 domain-containing protein [Candidatus Goldiibacteriota bacterium]